MVRHAFVLGVDIGGTNIKLGLVDLKGRVFFRTNFPTKSFVSNRAALIDAIVKAASFIFRAQGLARKNIIGVGIGLPGLIDLKRGVVNRLVNIPGWKNVPLRKIIEQRLKLPAVIDNDVNVITLGEWKYGAGRGRKNIICMTLGTGVGGGIVINNALYRGEGFSAGEIGHIPLNETGPACPCGGRGCLERYIGNRRLLEDARKIFRNKNISLEEITKKADRKEKKAIQFWQNAATHLGIGLAGVVNLLNPDCIVIGGGVANAHRHLFHTVYKTIGERAMNVPSRMVRIVKAKLGADAGLIGAQVLVTLEVSLQR